MVLCNRYYIFYEYQNSLFTFLHIASLASIIGDEKNIEEVVVTGTLRVDSSNISPIEVITEKDYRSFNITNLAELSKYLNISSGSRFQTNALGGVDQGMSSIALRGLDQASTLILINSKRHTFAGTPSNEGEGYIDVNIIPEIAFKRLRS